MVVDVHKLVCLTSIKYAECVLQKLGIAPQNDFSISGFHLSDAV